MGVRRWALVMLLVLCNRAVADWTPPVDDAYSFTHLATFIAPGESLLGQADIGLVHVDSEKTTDCHLYKCRVTTPIRGLKVNETLAFVDAVRDPEWYLDRSVTSSHGGLRPYPRLAANRDFLVVVYRDKAIWECEVSKHARNEGLEVVQLASCRTIRADVHGIHDILPQLKRLADALDRPAAQRPRPLREALFANLDTKHEYLRHLIESEFAYNEWAYPAMSKAEATRLANHSEGIDNYRRFHILEKLATKTPYPMDHWYLRALSRGTPGHVRVGDTGAVMAFDDSLNRAAPHLSIDSFWPMLERKTKPMSMWVHAFAKKRDPRLLPIILRYLDPANLDPTAAEALQNYRGVAAAEEAVVRAATDVKVKSDKRARALARESLKRLGTPRALAVADQLAGDDDKDSALPGRNR